MLPSVVCTQVCVTCCPLLCVHRYVVGLVFGFEHLLLVAAVLLQWSVHPVPKWVRVAIQRRNHLAMKRTLALAHQEGEGHTAAHVH